MSDEKAFKYAKRMLPHFRAVVKFCSTNRLFTYSVITRQRDLERLDGELFRQHFLHALTSLNSVWRAIEPLILICLGYFRLRNLQAQTQTRNHHQAEYS